MLEKMILVVVALLSVVVISVNSCGGDTLTGTRHVDPGTTWDQDVGEDVGDASSDTGNQDSGDVDVDVDSDLDSDTSSEDVADTDTSDVDTGFVIEDLNCSESFEAGEFGCTSSNEIGFCNKCKNEVEGLESFEDVVECIQNEMIEKEQCSESHLIENYNENTKK